MSAPSCRAVAQAHVSWYVHDSPDAAPVRVWVVAPSDPANAERVTIVMPGTLRNAEDYAWMWRSFAATSLVLVPEFSRTDWPGSRRYALGNVVRRQGEQRTLNRRGSWAFAVVEAIHARARATFGVQDDRFDLWGHSAGAQFAHRMALLWPDAPVRSYLAAGAGWYTIPDRTIAWPYGTGDPLLDLSDAEIEAWTTAPLTLMRGTDDVLRDDHLRTSARADRQGPNRFERAATMLRAGRAANPGCRWRLLDVPGAGHEPSKMALAAQDLLEAAAR